MSLVTTLTELKARLATVSGMATDRVLAYVVEAAPTALPLICLKVKASINGIDAELGTMDRRTLLWPIDIYFFGCLRTDDKEADLMLVLPYWEAIVAALDSDISLGNTLDSPIRWPDPMGGNPGVIDWLKTEYMGFILSPMFPVLTDTAYA